MLSREAVSIGMLITLLLIPLAATIANIVLLIRDIFPLHNIIVLFMPNPTLTLIFCSLISCLLSLILIVVGGLMFARAHKEITIQISIVFAICLSLTVLAIGVSITLFWIPDKEMDDCYSRPAQKEVNHLTQIISEKLCGEEFCYLQAFPTMKYDTGQLKNQTQSILANVTNDPTAATSAYSLNFQPEPNLGKYYSALTQLEIRYGCSGFCSGQVHTHYLFTNTNNGKPKGQCFSFILQDVHQYSMNFVIIVSVEAGVVALGVLWLFLFLLNIKNKQDQWDFKHQKDQKTQKLMNLSSTLVDSKQIYIRYLEPFPYQAKKIQYFPVRRIQQHQRIDLYYYNPY